MAELVSLRKDASASRVAVGFVGGLRVLDTSGRTRRLGEAVDCTASSNASTSTTGTSTQTATSARAGDRYLAFANIFSRRTFESICKTEQGAFGGALADFARIATLPCFDLQHVRPAKALSSYVSVRRLPLGQRGMLQNLPPNLEDTPENSDKLGWYYNADENRVCLTGLQRLIGDEYEIDVTIADKVDYFK